MALEVRELTGGYGPLQVLNGVSLVARPDQITALIGPNGAGKSTLLKMVYGFLRPTGGAIDFERNTLVGCRPEELLRRGILYIPQGRSVFPYLTVEENLVMGAYVISHRRQLASALERVYNAFPILKERRRQLAGTLSGGERRFVELARTLMLDARLVLLDEPSLGVAPRITAEIYRTVVRLHHEGVGFLVVDQNVRQVLRIAHEVYLLRLGRVRWNGKPAELANDEMLREVYLAG